MKRVGKKGFSLVELLCIIVILGLIVAMSILVVSKTITTSKKESLALQEKLLKTTCENYIQDNKSKAPKVVGESVNITLKELKEKKYLTEEIKNSSKESCMKKSYVRVYKLNNKEYTYLPLIYCGDDKVDDEVIKPDVKILFIDGNNNQNNNLIFNNMNEARLYIEITGGTTKGGSNVEINNYKITVSARTKFDSELKEYYNSDIIDASGKDTIVLDKKITSYLNLENVTSINVTIVASNIFGGIKEVTTIAQSNINNGN